MNLPIIQELPSLLSDLEDLAAQALQANRRSQ
jgi:hypothetical protein